MSDQRSTVSTWIRRAIIAFAVLVILFVAFELTASHEAVYRSESQLNISTGHERRVSWFFGAETVEGPRDTFISHQLNGEVVGNPEWRPMTVRRGASMLQSHGHTSTDRLWRACEDLDDWWEEGGFTESARAESARAILRLLQQRNPYESIHAYLDTIEESVKALTTTPVEDRLTTVEDLPDWKQFAELGD